MINYKLKHIKISFLVICLAHILINILNVPYEFLLSRISFFCVIILGLVLLVSITKNRVISWFSVTLNPELMPMCRILYGLLCLFSAIQHFGLIKYGMEPYNFLIWGIETPSILAYTISTLNIVALVFLIIGYKIRLAWILLFILGGAVLPFSLEIFVKNIFNFYAIFIPAHIWLGVNNEKTKSYNGWPVLLMCFSYAVLMTFAGVFKLLDPVWNSGLGLYYSLNIPFFTPRYLWFLLDNELLVKSLNWVTIMFEVLSLPLIIFKKTRVYGLLTLIGLGFFLTIVMEGIGVMGGPIVLVACMVGLSLTRYPKLIKVKVSQFFCKHQTNQSFCPKWLGLIVFWWSLIGVYTCFYKYGLKSIIYSPPKYGNYTVNKKPVLNPQGVVYNRLYVAYKIFSLTRPPVEWEFIWILELFDYHHLFDRVYFRTIFFDESGKIYEPVEFFDNEGAISENQPLPGNEKFVLTAFRIMDAVRSNSYVNEGVMSVTMKKELRGIVEYSKLHSDKDFVRAKIQIKQILQPYKYEGNYKDWKTNKWLDLYTLNFEDNSEEIEIDLPIYNYSKLSVKEFKDAIITPNF